MNATSEAAAPDDAAADRIEQALERIAALAARPRHAAVAATIDGSPIDAAAFDVTLAPRLDAVIARLRQALGS
ncbi:MAG: hypothetical protein KGK10_03630 [Rhodospirillales bacterium]|nr:hypothetical protein [Rhodospirillales bacterium]